MGNQQIKTKENPRKKQYLVSTATHQVAGSSSEESEKEEQRIRRNHKRNITRQSEELERSLPAAQIKEETLPAAQQKEETLPTIRQIEETLPKVHPSQ